MFACAKLGAVINPLNYRLPSGDVEYILNDVASGELVFEEATRDGVSAAREGLGTVEEYEFIDNDTPNYASVFYRLLSDAPAERPDIAVDEDDVYAFIYTSRTTGRPKGVVHEHRDMVEHNLINVAEASLGKRDVGLSVAPLYHCAELHCAFFAPVQVGATTAIQHDFDSQSMLQGVDEHDVTVMFAPPTMWKRDGAGRRGGRCGRLPARTGPIRGHP